MKIAIAQLNCVVGDLAGNVNQIIDSMQQAKADGATMLLTPELSLCGYSPEDLLFRQDFLDACDQALLQLSRVVKGITVLVGHPHQVGGHCYNAASVLEDGKIVATYHKFDLPNYRVFDEARYFTSADAPVVFSHEGVNIGVLICADIWVDGPAIKAKAAGAELLVVLNASPFHIDKQAIRYDILGKRVAEVGLPIVYTNLVGGQDELVFDGASFVMDANGQVTNQLPQLTVGFQAIDFKGTKPIATDKAPILALEPAVYQTLVLGLKDYIEKNHFKNVVLGLSGGVDSALTLAVAVDALGADRVHAMMMPSEFTADMSVNDAQKMAEGLGVKYSEIAIKDLYESYIDALAPQFGDLPLDTTEENLQARIRGMLLMAVSNKFGSIVVTTGNKSEMAVGYCTLYGDMAGGFALLKDVPKTLVYRLCHYRNAISHVIPSRIITRPPSAELRPDQVDQDSLPPYEVLDEVIEAYVENNLGVKAIVALGFDEALVKRVLRMIDVNEYKRRQSPVGVRITERGFGKDRRLPVTVKLDYDVDI